MSKEKKQSKMPKNYNPAEWNAIGKSSTSQEYAFGINGTGDMFKDKNIDKDKTIADLEAKLAESENRNEQLVDALNGEVFINYKLPMENAQLKQQLAEKEKEIESLRENSLSKRIFKEKLIPSHCMEQYEKYEEEIDKLKQQLAEKEEEINMLEEHKFYADNIIQTYADKCKKANQDKISFAVEQLEELRLSFICNYHDNISWIDDRENSCCLNLTTTIYNTTIDIFNNQIAELKKEMK